MDNRGAITEDGSTPHCRHGNAYEDIKVSTQPLGGLLEVDVRIRGRQHVPDPGFTISKNNEPIKLSWPKAVIATDHHMAKKVTQRTKVEV